MIHRRFINWLCAVGFLLTVPIAVSACGCLPRVKCMIGDLKGCVEEYYKGAPVIFLGKVVGRDRKEAPPPSPSKSSDTELVLSIEPPWMPGFSYIADVEVEIGWKGFKKKLVKVKADSSDGVNCGIDLHIGSSYVFYTALDGESYYANACNVAGPGDAKYLPKGKRITNKKE